MRLPGMTVCVRSRDVRRASRRSKRSRTPVGVQDDCDGEVVRAFARVARRQVFNLERSVAPVSGPHNCISQRLKRKVEVSSLATASLARRAAPASTCLVSCHWPATRRTSADGHHSQDSSTSSRRPAPHTIEHTFLSMAACFLPSLPACPSCLGGLPWQIPFLGPPAAIGCGQISCRHRTALPAAVARRHWSVLGKISIAERGPRLLTLDIATSSLR